MGKKMWEWGAPAVIGNMNEEWGVGVVERE